MNDQLHAQVSLYSTSGLSKFNRSLVGNVNLASTVKELKLFIPIDEEDPDHTAHVYTLSSRLPNLQHFFSPTLPCFISVKEHPTVDCMID